MNEEAIARVGPQRQKKSLNILVVMSDNLQFVLITVIRCFNTSLSNRFLRSGGENLLWVKFFIITYLLTPWSRVLLEMLTGSQLVKEFSEFNGNRRFIATFTRA